MEIVTQIIDWFQSNKLDLVILVTSIIGTASIIVKLTPTPKDDEILGKIKNFISKFIALNK